MDVLFLVLIILFFSFFLSKIFSLMKLPRVLGPLFLGLVFSYFFSSYLTSNNLEVLEILGTLGIIMFLFYIGLELDIKSLIKEKKETFFIGFFGFFLTFFIGFTFSYFFLNFNLISSLVIGVILTITAQGVVSTLLSQNNLTNSKIGRSVLGAGVIDGLFGILFLTFLTFLSINSFNFISFLPLIIGVFSFILGFYFLKFLTRFVDSIFINRKLIKSYDLFTYSLIFLLFFAVISESFGFDFTLGAIIAGIFLNFALHQKGHLGDIEEKRIDSDIRNLSLGFLSYFFYFGIGFMISFNYIFENYFWAIGFAIIILFSKIFSSFFSNYILNQNFSSNSILIGTALSSKGGIELIILEIARRNNLISLEIFSALVLTSLILLILSPITFNLTKNLIKTKI